MPFYKIIKLSLLFFFWFNSAFTQNYPVKNYTAANELPNNAVRSLLVDSKSILWIGTENGVVKKENDVFKAFFEEDGLALNSCWAIAEDKNNNLWFGSYGEGVSFYDRFNFKVISEEDGLIHNEITKLYSSGNYMYVGTSNGVSIVDVNTLEVISLDIPPDNELFRVTDFIEYKNQIYVITYRSGIYKIQKDLNLTSLTKLNNHQYVYSVFVENDSIYSSNKGYFTKSSLTEYINEESSLSAEKFKQSITWDYVKTSTNKIFAAAWGIYDSNGGIYELADHQMISRASEFSLPSKEVISLAYDPKFEKLYAGTKDSGLFEITLDPEIKFTGTPGKDILGFAETGNTSAVLFNNGILLTGPEEEREITLVRLKEWQENYVSNTQFPLPKHRDDFYELDYATKARDIDFMTSKLQKIIIG